MKGRFSVAHRFPRPSARPLVRLAAVAGLAVVLTPAPAARAETALEHLLAARAPKFADDHELLPLTRWGWQLSPAARIHLAEEWGYCLALGTASRAKAKKLDDPESAASRIVDLAAKDPKRYPLAVLLARPLNDKAYRAKLPDSLWLHDADGEILDVRPYKRYSPEAPTRIFERVARAAVAPLKKIRERAPIAVVLNGGEYGLNVAGHVADPAKKDPRVVEAKGDRSWFSYLSQQKARQEMPITRAVRKAVPDRRLYLWYHFGGMPEWQGKKWAFAYEPMQDVADRPGQSLYYKHFNDGWSGKRDLLTCFLESVAEAKQFGDRLSYNWVCAGWKEGERAEITRYTGFLKCLYAAGQIGAVAGYFERPEQGFRGDVGAQAPYWLRQMIALARVHALFTRLDGFLRDGRLLPGPKKHALEPAVAAHELPAAKGVRVLARKRADEPEWLLTAWAATGDARRVRVTVPELGEVTLEARPAGSVYVASRESKMAYEPPRTSIERVDPNAMRPTRKPAP